MDLFFYFLHIAHFEVAMIRLMIVLNVSSVNTFGDDTMRTVALI